MGRLAVVDHRRWIIAGACALTLAPALAAHAQSAAAPGASPPGVPAPASIVVTARKRPELAQKVPIALDVFSQKDLERLDVASLADLQAVSPSVYVQPSTFRQDTVNLTIRGQQNFQSTDLSFDTAAAVYVDGVYYARPVGLTGALFDTDDLEVLKGPQGTLVGRNSTGGAILLQTRQPDDHLGGLLRVEGGDYGHEAVRAILNLPLTDTLWLRAAIDQTGDDGYIANHFYDPATGARNDTPGEGARKLAGRFSLKWRPNDRLSLVLRGDFDTEHDTGATYHDLGYFVGTTPAGGGKASICNIPATCTGFTDLTGQVISPYFSNFPTSKTVSGQPGAYNALLNSVAREQQEGFWSAEQAVSNYDVGHFQDVSAQLDADLGGDALRWLSAYRWFDTSGDAVSRGLPYATNIFLYDTPQYRSYQSELTLNGAALEQRLKWSAGLFAFAETSPDDGDQLYLFLPSGIAPAPVAGRQITYTDPTRNTQANASFAAYAQATYDLTAYTRLTAGLRLTRDLRWARLETRTVRFPASPQTTAAVPNGVYDPASVTLDGITYAGQTQACALTDAAGVLLPLPDCEYRLRKAYDRPTWTLAIDHDLTQALLVYFTTRSGYRAGAINAASINPAALVAAPETVQDYEVGLKADGRLMGMPARLDLDAYYSDYRNIQIEASLPNVTVASVAGGGACGQAAFDSGQCLGVSNDNVTLNAKAARIAGAEWTARLQPVASLTLEAAGSYIDAVYTDYSFTPPGGYLRPVGAISLAGTHFPLPTWQLNGGVTYVLPLRRLAGLGVGEARLSWRSTWQGANQASLAGYNPSQRMKAYGLSNLRLDLSDVGARGRDLSFYVTNIFDAAVCTPEPQGVLNSAPNATFGVAGTSGVLQCVPQPPRRMGMTLSQAF